MDWHVLHSPCNPPNAPWSLLETCSASCGYLSYYFSDDLSGIPVRAITKINDNKADPNLETMTYGLFSRCNKRMRQSIVARSCRNVFFITKRGQRVLSGVYCLKWYVCVEPDDYALAADRVWFLRTPIPLTEVDHSCGTHTDRRFRTYLSISAEESQKLLNLVKGRPDASPAYLDEIARLERFNQKYSGFKYPTAQVSESYSWNCRRANELLRTSRMHSLRR